MAEINVLLKLKDSAGNVINPRKEDGHGSAAGTPTHVSVVGGATAAKQDTGNTHLGNISSDTLQLVVLMTALVALDFTKQGTKGTAANAWPVRDDLATESHADDQNGDGTVKNFAIAADSHFVMVDVDNTSGSDTATYRARATCDGSTPTAVNGFVCRSGQITYLPFPCVGGVVKVFAPLGTVVAAQGGKRA